MKVFLLVGVPGSGKSWVSNQLHQKYEYIPNDHYLGHPNQQAAYLAAIVAASKRAIKPLLIEAPFSVSQIQEPLEKHGLKIIPVVISEKPEVVSQRYLEREKKAIPQGHLTRMRTYEERAKERGWFKGTSQEVLAHLKAQ